MSRHYPKLAAATQDHKEHVLLARSTFEEGLEIEQDVQEINHLLVNEHKAEIFCVETKNDEVLQAVKAVVQSRWPEEKRKLSPTVAIFIPNRTFLVRFGGISGEFGQAMVRILPRRSRAKIPMARPNQPDMPPKRTKKVQLGTQIQPKIR